MIGLVVGNRFALVPTRLVTAIKLRIIPFAPSLSKGEWNNPRPRIKPSMLRQAQCVGRNKPIGVSGKYQRLPETLCLFRPTLLIIDWSVA